MNTVRVKVRENYPLPAKERRLIVANVLASDALMLVAGLAFAVVWSALAHGGWKSALLGMGWWDDVASSLSPHPAMIVMPVLLLVVFHVADRLLWPRSESYRAQVTRIRGGVNGELPRLNPALLLGLFAVVGFSEELFFRYGIAGFANWALGTALALPAPVAAALAVAVSAGVFTLAHVQYQNTFGTAVVCAIGVLFGAVFLWTGSLFCVAVAHWLYDFGDTMAERWLMARDADYFGAREAPIDAMDRAVSEARGRRG